MLAFRRFCYSGFAPLVGARIVRLSFFSLASENFLRREQSRRVVAFLVGHGMRTHFRVLTERGRRLARPQISANFNRDVQHFLFFISQLEITSFLTPHFWQIYNINVHLSFLERFDTFRPATQSVSEVQVRCTHCPPGSMSPPSINPCQQLLTTLVAHWRLMSVHFGHF